MTEGKILAKSSLYSLRAFMMALNNKNETQQKTEASVPVLWLQATALSWRPIVQSHSNVSDQILEIELH